MKATIRHADYSNVPCFARVSQQSFAGAGVLPNREVMAACLRAGGKKQRDVLVEVLTDSDTQTAYRVNGQFGELVVIEHETGEFRVYDLGASDEESEAAAAEVMAEFGV